jgi:F0F1-type ATP synthase membrane subunit c/vacuolar-type H+-ATPase subunit K
MLNISTLRSDMQAHNISILQGSLYMKNLLFASYAIFNAGVTVGFSNLFCGYGLNMCCEGSCL